MTPLKIFEAALESLISDNSAGGAQTIRDLYTNEIKRLKELLYGKNAAAQSVYDANAKLLNDSTDKALAETYTAKQNSLRNLAQVLSASGISGGGAESTAMGIENKYANTRGKLESERSRGLGELLQSLQKTTNENNQSYFDSAAKAEKEKTERLYNLKKAYDEQILNIKKAMLK